MIPRSSRRRMIPPEQATLSASRQDVLKEKHPACQQPESIVRPGIRINERLAGQDFRICRRFPAVCEDPW